MMKQTIEYVGFKATAGGREYTLHARSAESGRDYRVSIPNGLFVSGRAKFQEGPELAYQKLQREMAAQDAEPAKDSFTITDAELDAFREAHRAQVRPRRRTTPPAPPDTPGIG
jgi:hypothetical protein